MNVTDRANDLCDKAKALGLVNPITGEGMPSLDMIVDALDDAESDAQAQSARCHRRLVSSAARRTGKGPHAMNITGKQLAKELRLVPLTIAKARMFIARNHRHNKPPQGGLFAVGAELHGAIVGAAIIGRPVARMMDDGSTCEIVRLCTDGTHNACSLLYGAAVRAAKALGWSQIITYTLASEPGTSLRASGWSETCEVKGEMSWSRPSRPRMQTDLFGEAQRPTEDKIRWIRKL
jgi:hypothetical protein